MQKTVAPYLWINAVIFTVIGLAVMVDPSGFARGVDITAESPTAVADFRAIYGGLCWAFAAVAGVALRRPSLRGAAVLTLVLICDGLMLGRLVSWVTHGPGEAIIFVQLGVEVVSAIWGSLLLRDLGAHRVAHA